MAQGKQAAQQAKDLLTLCLAKAIDQCLCVRLGPRWFCAFLADDREQDPKFQIARNGQVSIRDLDLQALLKILRYRERFSNLVFSHYGLSTGNDPFADQTRQRQIRSLLDRLITDFRNSIEAHSRVADIEQDHRGEDNRIYGYREALQDMCKLASLFPHICDEKGKSYHKQIEKLCKPKRSLLWLIPAAALAAALVTLLIAKPWSQPAPAPEPPTTGNVFYNLNNAFFEPDDVTIRPTHIYYDDGMLVAKCLILNGRSTTVSQLEVEALTVMDGEDTIIAQAAFGSLEDLTIPSNRYEEWTFYFPKETVLLDNALLQTIHLQFQLQYLY